MARRVLSGMRPTGRLHIGHYLGALRNWVALQQEFECFFMVADWHALMSESQDPSKIREYAWHNVADWLACGIDPERSVVFFQSQVPEHAEMHLVLSAYTPLGWLERVPTYKEAKQELRDRDILNYAFLGYPVLQAADILLYRAEVVPVGEDQVAHLEMTRELVRRFNRRVGRQVLVEPFPRLSSTPRILGTDGRKMSKSYDNTLELSCEPSLLRRRVLDMFTDPQRARKSDPGRPEVCNVYSLHRVFSPPEKCAAVYEGCTKATLGCVEDKEDMAQILESVLRPIRERARELRARTKELREIVEEGNRRAREVASRTMAEVREAIFGAG